MTDDDGDPTEDDLLQERWLDEFGEPINDEGRVRIGAFNPGVEYRVCGGE
jgi:hypothetical protein